MGILIAKQLNKETFLSQQKHMSPNSNRNFTYYSYIPTSILLLNVFQTILLINTTYIQINHLRSIGEKITISVI